MKHKGFFALLALAIPLIVYAQIVQRPLSPSGLSEGVTYFLSGTPNSDFSPMPSNGELAIRNNPGAPPELVIWDASVNDWVATAAVILTGAGTDNVVAKFSGGALADSKLTDDGFGLTGDSYTATIAFATTNGSGGDIYLAADASAVALPGGETNAILQADDAVLLNSGVTAATQFAVEALETSESSAASQHGAAELTVPVPTADGGDIWSGLLVDIANTTAHTGAGNFLYGIEVQDVVLDADMSEYGIYVEDAWDSELVFESTVSVRTLAGGTTWQIPAGNAWQVSNGGATLFSVNDSADIVRMYPNGSSGVDVNPENILLPTVTQATLVSDGNGSIAYCSDCNPDATCTGAGSGAFAFRINGAWACELN